MAQYEPGTRLGQVRIPDCSADWRFLLPIANKSSVLVVSDACDEFGLSLEAIGAKNTTWRFEDLTAKLTEHPAENRGRPDELPSFDVVAFPLGVPEYFASEILPEFPKFLESILQMLTPGGGALFGFANHIRFRRKKSRSSPMRATREEMKSALIAAGYSAVEIYGAFPNLYVPEYIFSPAAEDFSFILRRRYKHKLPSVLLKLVSSPWSAQWILKVIPFYYAVAYRSAPSVRHAYS